MADAVAWPGAPAPERGRLVPVDTETVEPFIPYIDTSNSLVASTRPRQETQNVNPGNPMQGHPNQGHWSQDGSFEVPKPASGRIVLRMQGEFSHAELERFIRDAEAWSLEAADGVVTRKRLLNVLVEALENLRLHTEPKLAPTSFAELHADEGGYTLLAGSAIPSAKAEFLKQRIEILNEMSEADLKEHFLRLLSNQGRTEHGGAGLGLLTIARKSHRPLRVLTAPCDEATQFMVLETRILRDA